MQDLTTNATGGYTLAQLTERLTSDGAAFSCRFDILDPFLNKTANVGEIDATDAVVEYDSTREIVGSLGLTMLPNETINRPFYYRIKPWFRLQMLDGGFAEWPLGVYLWNVPLRDNVGRPDEYWTLTLGDQTQVLQLAGPGATGHAIGKGAVITDEIARVVALLGMDTSGIVPSPATVTDSLHWGVYGSRKATSTANARYWAAYHRWQAAEAAWKAEVSRLAHMGLPGHHNGVSLDAIKQRLATARKHQPKRPTKPSHSKPFAGEPATSWLDVLGQLHAVGGYFPPYFDLTGRYRAQPQPDLPTAVPAMTYSDGANGVVVTPAQASDDLSAVCNRVFAQGQTANGYFDIGVADLDAIVPGHPLGQQTIGFYIDVTVQDQASTTNAGLVQTAAAELHRRTSTLRQYNVETLAWPVHEANEILQLALSADAEIGTGVLCIETDWALDLREASMTHVMQRIAA